MQESDTDTNTRGSVYKRQEQLKQRFENAEESDQLRGRGDEGLHCLRSREEAGQALHEHVLDRARSRELGRAVPKGCLWRITEGVWESSMGSTTVWQKVCFSIFIISNAVYEMRHAGFLGEMKICAI